MAAKESLSIPVVGSLKGHSTGGWAEFASQIEQVCLNVVAEVEGRVSIPVAA